MSVHPPPPPPPTPPVDDSGAPGAMGAAKSMWDEPTLVSQAREIIVKELKAMLEKDVAERVIGTRVRELADMARTQKKQEREKLANVANNEDAVPKPAGARLGLKGLSFKKKRKREEEKPERGATVTEDEAEAMQVEVTTAEDQEPAKRKKRTVKVVADKDDVESEDDIPVEASPVIPPLPLEPLESNAKKRPFDEDVPTGKKSKKRRTEASPDVSSLANSEETLVASAERAGTKEPVPRRTSTKKATKAKKRPTKKKSTKAKKEPEPEPEDVLMIAADELPEPVVVVDIPEPKSTLSSPLASPTPSPPPERPPTPPPDPFALGLCEDDEDLYFVKGVAGLALGTFVPPPSPFASATTVSGPVPPAASQRFRVHATGSARTEGYYKIPHTEKAGYVAQYTARGAEVPSKNAVESAVVPQQPLTSSRSNRASARVQARGVDDLNKALALSMADAGLGGSKDSVLIKFNQLQTRKKQLRFARSPIHDWGLYAMEKIGKNEMVIEYVGEVIRQAVADKREKAYERQGIGSSYLFRIDDDLVVDATKKGNLG